LCGERDLCLDLRGSGLQVTLHLREEAILESGRNLDLPGSLRRGLRGRLRLTDETLAVGSDRHLDLDGRLDLLQRRAQLPQEVARVRPDLDADPVRGGDVSHALLLSGSLLLAGRVRMAGLLLPRALL